MPPTPTAVDGGMRHAGAPYTIRAISPAADAVFDKGVYFKNYAGGFNPHAKEFYPLQMTPPSLEEISVEKMPQPASGYGFGHGQHPQHAHHPAHPNQHGHGHAQAPLNNGLSLQAHHPSPLHQHGLEEAPSPSIAPLTLGGTPHVPQGATGAQYGSPVTTPETQEPLLQPTSFPEVISEVWRDTLDQAMDDMSALVHDGYNCIGMDTEFPGVVARAPVSNSGSSKGYASMWNTIRVNVNILKVIQIGMCFRDKDGKAPQDRPSTFQINFHFDLDKDIYAVDSISMLQSSGIDFDLLKKRGCDVAKFAELLMSSGLVLSDEITWVAFGAGYDFAYLIRLLTSQEVPYDERDFLDLVTMYFPSFFDTKYMARESSLQHNGGLEALANMLDTARIGRAHQAGSDSLVTVNVFFKLLSTYYTADYEKEMKLAAIKNVLSGFEPGASTPTRPLDE